MKRLLLMMSVVLAGCKVVEPGPSPPFVAVEGVEAERYVRVGWAHWKRCDVLLDVAAQRRLHLEATGAPMLYDPPALPGWGEPRVFRERSSGVVFGLFGAYGGWLEVVFAGDSPPRVVRAWFTDGERRVRFGDAESLYRHSCGEWAAMR
jgi:hypothetical protein